jgi:putative oxidoreductase
LPAVTVRPIIGAGPGSAQEMAMMNIAYSIGRIFLPVIFIVAGVQKLMNVQPFAERLAALNIPIPAEVVLWLDNIPKYNALGWLLGGIEVICGLMVLIGLKARWAALVLVVYAACTIFFVHHFWDMDTVQFALNQESALLYLAVIGGLLLVVAGVPRPTTPDYR